ncbi:phage tail protein [Parasutterella excrementihominis]|uniref:phage tail protein n=1 Tax=Parasutterella excrementihominis TaxID=487175 RepID=UPI00206C1F19|nr:MAG TPA: Baseplate wedge protein [Caudoviricetes sp.]
MDRAYGARVVQVEPKFAEDAPLGYPTDGSSTGGQLATVPKAPWYNAVTEEIRNAILGGGIKPEKNTLDQLNRSIEARLKTLEEKIEKTLKGVTDRVDKFETFPPGFIIYTGGFINNPNWLFCDGRAVSRSGYANLFKAIGTTWGAGNGSTTFNIPYLLDRVLWGSNWGVGQYIDSGAPQVWAEMGCDDRAGDLANGAAYRLRQRNINTSASGGDSAPWAYFRFEASRCSPVYGRTNHIQPPASRAPVYIHI